MKLKIYKDRKVFMPTKQIGINNENKATTLELEYPEQYATYTKTIEMQDGDWLVTDTIENDEYVFKSNVTSHKNISAQIVFTDDNNNVIFKSEIFKIEFKDALNAEEPLDDTDAKAEEILIGKKAYVQSEKITGTMANNGELNYTPTTQAQIIPEGYTSGGIIGAVTSDIDANIIPTNIRAGVTILEVEGNLEPDKPDQNKTVTPTTQTQTIMADTGYELAQVTVEGVTSAIDSNIQAENIKKGVSILEVEGTYEPNLQNKSVTITENGTSTITPDEGYDGLSGVSITTNVSGSSKPVLTNGTMFSESTTNDFSWLVDVDTSQMTTMYRMFYHCREITTVPLFDTSNVTSISQMFNVCSKLTSIPLFNTSNVTNMNGTFEYCGALVDVPILNTSKITTNYNFRDVFASCPKLSNESLNNILAMCIGATSYTGTKTLKYIGLTSAQATTCTTLSNWADAQAVGWITGY